MTVLVIKILLVYFSRRNSKRKTIFTSNKYPTKIEKMENEKTYPGSKDRDF